ncbi:multiple epidermal growth factor-like domains protein 10 isoform X2 [Ruditapes philippinarum]|uniref:multiple epidermal growth factor-like domains protein 10 isoform X2 n=1 Tax=Ruditapes philippinarum TaxID=129788 RepID=UPI00295B17BE|nr:multiple epidermal growth factor-like domains protein 10 isoform X2 [Ruditapes philippinarum]
MCRKMIRYFIFTKQIALHVLFIHWCVYQILNLECLQCDNEFKVICRQPCPSYCRQCSSDDLCLTCLSTPSNFVDTSSFLCVSSCEGQCVLNKGCLKDCSVLRVINTYRPVLCVTNDTCLNCLKLTGKCLQCDAGRYGNLCQKRCGYCQRDLKGLVKCNTNTGNCRSDCENGYFGERCDKPCKNCISVTKSKQCEKITGECISGCLPGWFYKTCNETCSSMCLHRTCHQISGYCVEGCITGWYGNKCEKHCNDNCKRSCDQISGNCSEGCITGWYGNKCEKDCNDNCKNRYCDNLNGYCTYGCSQGWFGETCESVCSDKCLHNSCHSSAACKYGCLPGWFGNTCETSCNIACYNRSCDQTTGVCEFGCINGFNGPKCSEIDHVFTNDSISLDGHKREDKTVDDYDIKPIVYGIFGSISGMFVTGLGCIMILLIRKAITRFRWYDYLNNSLQGNVSPIYDEILQTNECKYLFLLAIQN